MMNSLYDELSEKLEADPRLSRRGGPRFDLSLLLFNARADLRELWHAAEAEVARAKGDGVETHKALEAAVDKLRPIFGRREERGEPSEASPGTMRDLRG